MIKFIVILTMPLISFYNIAIQSTMSSYIAKMNLSPDARILRGAESVFVKGSNSKAVLMIHGYIGAPTDYGRLSQLLSRLGYTVSVPLLPGHGRDPRSFSEITSAELIKFVSAEYERLKQSHEEVIVIGFSMGGALATILENQYSFYTLILLAPYYEIAHQWYYVLPAEFYNNIFSPYVPYVYRPKMFKQINDRTSLDKIIAYDYISTKGSQHAIELGKQAKQLAPYIKARTLIIHSKKDKATDYKTVKRISDSIAGLEKFVSLEKSNHLILWDYESRLVEDEIIQFLAEKTSAGDGLVNSDIHARSSAGIPD